MPPFSRYLQQYLCNSLQKGLAFFTLLEDDFAATERPGRTRVKSARNVQAYASQSLFLLQECISDRLCATAAFSSSSLLHAGQVLCNNKRAPAMAPVSQPESKAEFWVQAGLLP